MIEYAFVSILFGEWGVGVPLPLVSNIIIHPPFMYMYMYIIAGRLVVDQCSFMFMYSFVFIHNNYKLLYEDGVYSINGLVLEKGGL